MSALKLGGARIAYFVFPPSEAALPMVLAVMRKDGILLFSEFDLIEALRPLQVLTVVSSQASYSLASSRC